MNFIAKILLSKYVKGLLDKLPLDGKKTWLSGILFVVVTARSVVCNADGHGQVCAALALVDDFLGKLGAEAISQDVAIALLGGFVLGLFHKFLKFFERKTRSE